MNRKDQLAIEFLFISSSQDRSSAPLLTPTGSLIKAGGEYYLKCKPEPVVDRGMFVKRASKMDVGRIVQSLAIMDISTEKIR